MRNALAGRPIAVVELFPELHVRLLALLRRLDDRDWQRPTVCSKWCVKDIAAHLLDGDLRRLSAQRDGYRPPEAPMGFSSSADLLAYLNQLNASWTQALTRLSPRVLIELLEASHPPVVELYRSLDPQGPALYSVAWAGEDRSANWFDIAREYTERWHHQAQIRLAVGQMEDLLSPRLYRLVLDVFFRALPFTFREVEAPAGTAVVVEVAGEAGGTWSLERDADRWTLYAGDTPRAVARVVIPAETAWQLFTKRLDRRAALERFPGIRPEGDVDLASRVLEMVSIIA